MESRQQWRTKLSYKNATILICFVNLIAALLLVKGFLDGSSKRVGRSHQFDSAQIRLIMESEAMRRAMEPVELIKRLQEIQQEYIDPETEIKKPPKQSSAVDLSKRLKDLRATNDANSQKALEEWRKRKMERARQRGIGKNNTITSLK